MKLWGEGKTRAADILTTPGARAGGRAIPPNTEPNTR